MQPLYTHRVTAANGAIASTLAPGVPWQLHEMRLHLSAAGANENITLTMDAVAGATYDCVIYAGTTNSLTDVNYLPARPRQLCAADEIDIALVNTNARAYGVEIVYSHL